MLISVQIKQLYQHLDILKDEIKEIKLLYDLLNYSYNQALIDMNSETEAILKQLTYIHKQERAIERRIEWLEIAITKFSNSKDIAVLTINDANEIIQRLYSLDMSN
jgi:chaperonin cofactor prefoldin